MKTRKYLFFLFMAAIFVSCSTVKLLNETGADKNHAKNFVGEYITEEKYEVHAGAMTDHKGNSSYTITILPGSKENELIVEKFANSYKVIASVRGDSIFFPSQKFPYLKKSVTISGQGKLTGDTLFYNYFSGGPAGQIDCYCKAVKKR